MRSLLVNWGISTNASIIPIGDGLIHQTFKIVDGSKSFILQKINTQVFKKPEIIYQNVAEMHSFLALNGIQHDYPVQILTLSHLPFAYQDDQIWRLTSYVETTFTINTASFPEEAYEAAHAFGLLAKRLSQADCEKFKETIPNFHHLGLRYDHFARAVRNSEGPIKKQASRLIDRYEKFEYLAKQYSLVSQLPKRIQHHDTKINNVLFDQVSKKSKSVCDFDTLMPGLFVSDLGDMIRTYSCALDENSVDFGSLKIRSEFLEAIFEGYLSEMGDVLSPQERNYLDYAGPMMFYMQGLRFLTDFLERNKYYPVTYADQNLDRATNQIVLLEDYENRLK